jgi:mono/diheme cytochrome c family protein
MARTFVVSLLIMAPAALAAREPTFYKDVLPVLQKNCQSCHRPGEIGPMPLLTLEQARPWAKAIRQAVVTKKMPPWFADPTVGKFANDRSLSKEEIATLASWADSGTQEGSKKDAPKPVAFTDG